MASRYIVGIDLGTTNCAVAYVDSRGRKGVKTPVATFSVPQLVAAGEIKPLTMLPSFLYVPGSHDLPPGSAKLPWNDSRHFIVGIFAREQGARVPARLISSAKSWLCHPGVDRRAAILPWACPPDVRRFSPIQASAEYLQHIREAWNATIAAKDSSAAFENQDIVLTVPASFDEIARDLTVEAATQAGLSRITLIEEPQAAFYAWLDENAGAWSKHVSVGQVILVCDVGGGTTDFTLIRADESNGKLAFRRLAVGDHLMLGGDNMDVALARQIEVRLMGQPGKLDSVQWSGLIQSCRAAKETLLGDDAPERVPVAVAGRTSKVIGGRLQVDLERDEVLAQLLDGFVPLVPWDAEPTKRQAAGLQEFGLPYVSDPAITRHLAKFLRQHQVAATEAQPARQTRPDAVLFNGGALTPAVMRRRILDAMSAWFSTPKKSPWSPTVLDSRSLDLAVARGAAHYGVVRRGGGIRISGGTARTYYVGIESPGASQPLSLCVVPRGMEEGEELPLAGREFQLLVGKPVSFPIYTSTTRMHDRPGDVVPVDEQTMEPMAPVQTTLRAGSKSSSARMVPVSLLTRYTELGTVELWCVASHDSRRWRLQFQTRAIGQPAADSAEETESEPAPRAATDRDTLDEGTVAQAKDLIQSAFASGPAAPEGSGHEDLMHSLRGLFGIGRDFWPTAALRELWDAMAATADGRRQTPGHERRWTNLAGFCLRPGYGYPHDDSRVALLWRLAHTGPVFVRDESCRVQWWIMSRRVAAGLKEAQQEALFGRLAPALLPTGSKPRKAWGERPSNHELVEIWRLAASLSRIAVAPKIELGQTLLRSLKRPPFASHVLWSLARIGARVPLYGSAHTVVSHEIATDWIEYLLDLEPPAPKTQERAMYGFALCLTARRSGDRHRDISDDLRARVTERLESLGAPDHQIRLVAEVTTLDAAEQQYAFGESLPAGLHLVD
jgi:molecular chaperone DnaK (HSP70)